MKKKSDHLPARVSFPVGFLSWDFISDQNNVKLINKQEIKGLFWQLKRLV